MFFLTYLQMWLPESDVRRIIRKMLSFHGKTEKNCCLVDTAFSTGCDEKSFVSIFGESAAAAAAAAPFIEAASSARKDGSPPHALHTRTVRRWYTVSWFTKNGTIIFLTSKIAGCFSNQTTNHVLGIFFSIHWLLVKYNHSPWMITFRSGLSPIL